MTFYDEIIQILLTNKIQTKEQLHREKIRLCKKYKINTIPADSDILAHLPQEHDDNYFLLQLLQKKKTRTLSGVAIIAVMTSPAPCPHGRCIPCPGGPQNNTPQSYTGHEPAAMRAALNAYDPYQQTKNRLHQLSAIGHPIDKIDFIIMGGTFTARHPHYQQWFVKRCYDALNNSSAHTIEEAKKKNEHASSRCIGLTIETRPDWFQLQHVDFSLHLGATRVELGAQTLDEELLHQMCRGHTVYDIIAATRIAKDAGFKVCYHMMPGLPGSTMTKDIAVFRTLFQDSRFKPDMLKIYPTLIVADTQLFELWKQGEYKPLTTEKAVKLLATIKKEIPSWVRIQRINRDIPTDYITAGVTKSNLRQLVEEELENHGKSCRCIRCREIGLKLLKHPIQLDQLSSKIYSYEYTASNGTEIFLSLEDKDIDVILGYLRLREIKYPYRVELNVERCMMIRELKILGPELSFGKRREDGIQHRGFGKELIREAEKICSEKYDLQQLFVLSGIGVKDYYRKLGFQDTGHYLSKKLC